MVCQKGACERRPTPTTAHWVDRHTCVPEHVEGPDVDLIIAAVAEVERLPGCAAQRRSRWSALHRHLRFGQRQDWHDIAELDRPTVRSDIEAGALSGTNPSSWRTILDTPR